VSDPVIHIANVTRRFGDKTALDSVSLSLPRGGVYGLVGANGAGKTTLIKHILGLLRAESGSVRVLGADPVADPVAVLSHRLPVRGERSARLDARRRPDALLARILSAVG
jgi:ABC-2 type transport system ATP-binding protein